ncbi:hypothetical protein QJQ45_023722 [Haematococcus lacustris]|nr:hypothetical protein QJQ45_023722 [Haematococcus lacustris]
MRAGGPPPPACHPPYPPRRLSTHPPCSVCRRAPQCPCWPSQRCRQPTRAKMRTFPHSSRGSRGLNLQSTSSSSSSSSSSKGSGSTGSWQGQEAAQEAKQGQGQLVEWLAPQSTGQAAEQQAGGGPAAGGEGGQVQPGPLPTQAGGTAQPCGAALVPPRRGFLLLLLTLPWEVVPFVLGMFVLVEGLLVQGWLAALAQGLGSVAGQAGVGGTLQLMGWLSVTLANAINNQPMTIMLTSAGLGSSPAPGAAAVGGWEGEGLQPATVAVQRAALFGVVVGSNAGAMVTLVGALAGIM